MRVFLHIEPHQLSPQVWAYLGGGGNSLVVVHKTEAFVADLKWGDEALRLKRTVEEGLDKKVQRVLLTHSHPDHWDGLIDYPDAGAVLAHPRTHERITAALKKQRRPDVYGWIHVTSEVRLVLGEEEVWIRHLGVGHTDGDLAAFLPGLNLVMTGDLFSTGFEPTVDEAAGGRLLGLRRALDAMLGYEFEAVLPGYGQMGKRADVVAVRDYLAAMEAALREAAGRGLSEDAAVDAGEAALKSFPRLEVLPLQKDRRGNLRAMYRELTPPAQTDTSGAP
ncbi:MAG TPA: MBL fold metallo-hydrolase [Myxococcaceae bacterium]|nr:MBL fold metallo-hydrolase [Myxococcaceae bacterium]